MVGGDDDEGLIGVLHVKLVGYADGLVHVDGLVEDGGGVVGVAGVVYLTPFYHEEEALLLALLAHEEG